MAKFILDYEIDFYRSLSMHQNYNLADALRRVNEYPLNREYGTHVISHRTAVTNALDDYIRAINEHLIQLNADEKIENLAQYLKKADEHKEYWKKELKNCTKVVRDYEAYRKTKDYKKDIRLKPTGKRFKTTPEYAYKYNNTYLPDNIAFAETNTNALDSLTKILVELSEEAELASDKYRNCIKMVAWCHDFGLTDFLLKLSNSNFTRAAKLLESITGTKNESIRKVMEAIYKPNESNTKNSPFKQENQDYIAEMRKNFSWLKEKQGNLK